MEDYNFTYNLCKIAKLKFSVEAIDWKIGSAEKNPTTIKIPQGIVGVGVSQLFLFTLSGIILHRAQFISAKPGHNVVQPVYDHL